VFKPIYRQYNLYNLFIFRKLHQPEHKITMKVSSLTLYLTDDCNFNCTYCYQTKGKEYMPEQTLENAMVFYFPFLTDRFDLNFYGGEPLLAFDLIKKAISKTSSLNEKLQKKGEYSLTTNGSFMTEEILDFLNNHKFSVELSFDGLAHDLQRKKGSSRKVTNTLKELLDYPNIQVEVNSVFTSSTIDTLYESIKYILNFGVPRVNFSLSTIARWDEDSLEKYKMELTKLRGLLLRIYKNRGNIPVRNFGEGGSFKRRRFSCVAGEDRFVVTPNSDVWGCFLFSDYFKGKERSLEFDKYYFGNLMDFANDHESIYPKISKNYSKLTMSKFFSAGKDCLFCSYFEHCRVCPINAAFSGSEIGNIQEHICKLKRIEIDELKRLHAELCG
jgi:radical SAM protein with 4Fe4S-binding SPASM domain